MESINYIRFVPVADGLTEDCQRNGKHYRMINHKLTRRFRSSAGEVAYDVEGAGRDIVLVHGTPTSSLIWCAVIDRLKSEYRLHYLDLPGYGASSKFEGQEVRLRSFARVLKEFIDHVGLDRPDLVGHDFGAAAVLGCHLLEGQPVRSLTIADGVVLNPWGTPFSRHVREHEHVFAKVPAYVHRATLAAHLATAVAREMPREMLDRLIEPWLGEAGQPAYYRQVAQYDYEYTEILEEHYPRIAAPTLIIWGEQDQWVNMSEGDRFRGLLCGARMETIPDAGHFPMVDCPGLFSRTLKHWLAAASQPAS